MRAMTWRKALTVAFALTVFALGLGAPSFAQPQDAAQKPTADPVADAARKAREQKKKETAKTKKVYTNEDMSELPANAVSTPGAATATETPAEGAANQGAKPNEQGNADKNPEKLWRKRFKDAYAKLAQLEKELDILQREDNKAQTQYYSDPQKAMTEGYTRKDINEKETKIAAKKQEIAQQKQQISEMEDDLRKAGGDPGWASSQ
jgi:hypothetical protein